MDRILIILKKKKPHQGFICLYTGSIFYNIQTCFLVYTACERLQDHWSSGLSPLVYMYSKYNCIIVLLKNEQTIRPDGAVLIPPDETVIHMTRTLHRLHSSR